MKNLTTLASPPRPTSIRKPRPTVLALSIATTLMGAAFCLPGSAHAAFTITPIFDSTFNAGSNGLTLAQSNALKNTVNSALSIYSTNFLNNETLPITFSLSPTVSGAESSKPVGTYTYSSYLTALTASAKTPVSATVIANLPAGATTDPVIGGSNISLTDALAFTLGLGDAQTNYGTCTFSLSSYKTDPAGFLGTIQHEVNEVIGLGSNLPNGTGNNVAGPLPTTIAPEDLFRYSANGTRNFSVNATSDATNRAYFRLSPTGPTLQEFNNLPNGGDYGDWAATGTNGFAPAPQDQAGPDNIFTSMTKSPAELTIMNAIGYWAVPVSTSSTFYWDGRVDGTWQGVNWATTAGDLKTASSPTGLTDVVFSITTNAGNLDNTTLGTDFSIRSLTINEAMPVTINSGGTGTYTLTVSANAGMGLDVMAGAGLFTLNANFTMGGASDTITVNNTAGAVINGVVGGANGLTKAGNGTLTLAGANKYKGATTITAGKIALGAANALPIGTTLSVTGTLELAGFAQEVAGLTGSGTVTNSGAAATFTVNNTTNSSFAGKFTGANLALAKGGATTLVLLGANTYGGGTMINGGALMVENTAGSGTGTGSVTVNTGATLGGTGTVTGAVNVLMGGNLNPGGVTAPGTLTVGSLVLDTGSTSTFRLNQMGVPGGGESDQVKVTGNLTLAGTLNVTQLAGFRVGMYTLFTYGGTLTNTGFSAINGLTGFTTSIDVNTARTVSLVVADGTPQYWDGKGAPNDGNITGGSGVWGGASKNWTNAAGTVNSGWQGGTAIFAGTGGAVAPLPGLTFEAMIFNSTGYSINNDYLMTLMGAKPTISVTNPGDTATIGNPLGGDNGLTASGAGTLILTGQNTYTGGTTVINGTVQLGAKVAGSVGGGAVSVGTPAMGTAGTLVLVSVTGDKFANAITNGIGGSGTLQVNSPSNNTLSGALTDGATGQLALTQSGAGTTILTNGGNSYTGATTVSAGTLQIGNGETGNLTGATTVTVSNTGTLVTNLGSGTTFTPAVELSVLAATLKAVQSGTNTLAGVISGLGGFAQDGTGTTILKSAETYTGATNVNAGALQVTGSLAAGGAAVNINKGGTLGGSGTIGAPMTLNRGGTLFPGVGSPGTAGTTLQGASLLWNSGSTLTLQLGAETTSDQLVLTDALTKGLAGVFTLDVKNAGITGPNTYTLATFASTTFAQTDFTLAPLTGYSETLVETATSLSLTLTVAAAPAVKPAVVTATDLSGTSTFNPVGSGSATVNPVPEPGSAALLALGGGALLGWRRRRSR